MLTEKIISELKSMNINRSNEDEMIEKVDLLMQELMKNVDGYLACEAMIELLERHPQTDFGGPGAIVHTIEDYAGYYEKHMFESLKRHPTDTTLTLLHRIINAEKEESEVERLLKIYKACAKHPLADKSVKYSVKEYLKYRKSLKK